MSFLTRIPLALAAAAVLAAFASVALPLAMSFALVAFAVVAAVTWMTAVHSLLERRENGARARARARVRRS